MSVDEDTGRCAMGDKGFVNFSDRAAFGGTSVELAVGKCSSSSFTKAVVGIFDNAAFTEQGRQVKASGRGIFSPL